MDDWADQDHDRSPGGHSLGNRVADALQITAAAELAEEERQSRAIGFSTELSDVTEVEYRKLRLEKVVLAAVCPPREQDKAHASLLELAALTETAGAQVLDSLLQPREQPDPHTYLGRGKAQTLKEIVWEHGADTVVADTELQPSQRRALEDIVQVKVIDRTAVILDIFSQHAKSREGKAHVELAQLEYLLPRLRGWGESMSRQAGGQVGGVGSRGPGETKIELDRRRIRARMSKLRRQIEHMSLARKVKGQQRQKKTVPSAVIVGYTNAGKSSLLNRLTHSHERVENALFATLDPAVRRCQTSRTFTLADTVGFVRNLPHQLVEAFRSTLEEVEGADLIIHLVDGSHPDPLGQIEVVNEVIADMRNGRELLVFNKKDLLLPQRELMLRSYAPDAVFISTQTGEGMQELTERIDQLLPQEHECWLQIPYDKNALVAQIYAQGQVLESRYCEEGSILKVKLPTRLIGPLESYVLPAEPE